MKNSLNNKFNFKNEKFKIEAWISCMLIFL
jgi:hypothetical protein